VGSDEPADAVRVRQHRFAVMSGIAHHRGFVGQLVQEGFAVVTDRRFPDHHAYTQEDLAEVVRAGKAAGASALMVTEKDAVRLEVGAGPRIPEGFPVFVLRIGIRMLWGEEQLAGGIERCLRTRAA
jgi:tetraacyldisaccharide 4'-kinase